MAEGVRQQIRELLVKAGEKGMTAQEIAEAAKISSTGPVYCHIFRLRKKDAIIIRNERYCLLQGKSEKEGSHALVKGLTKKEILGKALQEAGSSGLSKKDLISKLGTNEANLPSFIFEARQHGYNVKYNHVSKMYYLKSKGPASVIVSPSAGSGKGETGSDVKEMIKLLNPDDQETYLELLRKAMFYQKCADALINAKTYVQTLKEEVSSAS